MKMGSISIRLSKDLFKNVCKFIGGHTHINMSFTSNFRSKAGRIKSEFRNDICALNCDVDLDTAGPIVLASVVFGYNGEKLVKNNVQTIQFVLPYF
jgi:hypothetical protein